MDSPPSHFIPFRKRDIIEMLLLEERLDAAQDKQFREVCILLQSIFHFHYHETLENLKDAYAPLNPDRDTRTPPAIPQPSSGSFALQMESLLQRANYRKLTASDLKIALEQNSLFKLRLHVDFANFEDVLLFTRGEHTKTETTRQYFGLRKHQVSFPNFDRVVLYIKFHQDSAPDHRPDKMGTTLLKLFQNVPRADVDMLFPNTQVGMRLIDKLFIGVPAVAGGIVALSTKIGASLLLLGALLGYWLGLSSEPVELSKTTAIAVAAGLAGLGSFIWKQFSNFRNRKLRFLQSLTENLYFKNLDNNAGVFHRLVDDAEEEECKEAILAYFFLLTADQAPSRQTLDEQIEEWFRTRWDCELDFETEDALNKLERLGLVHEDRWDNYFAAEPQPLSP
jgi:hypothetical protein